MAFATTNLKDYVSKFLKSLLDSEDVASHSKIEALHKRIGKDEDAHKTFVAKVMQSASATNQADAEVKDNISPLLSSCDEIKTQTDSLKAEVQNLTGIIKLLFDDIEKG